jgi:hypothetical protein
MATTAMTRRGAEAGTMTLEAAPATTRFPPAPATTGCPARVSGDAGDDVYVFAAGGGADVLAESAGDDRRVFEEPFAKLFPK